MSASTDSSSTDIDTGVESDAPRIEALFLIRFDKKVGYTIVWKRTRSDIALENAVEFKSLPSGLHSVQSDLVYFTHEGYAGLSAFAKGDASAEERNANFVSVGILVRKEGRFGRLGRAWLLAGRLESMAAALAEDSDTVTPLEELWAEQTSMSKPEAEALDKKEAKAHSRARAVSTLSALIQEDEKLPDNHPALSILRYIDVFGPLIFRLQQAALLRKRILFVGNAPVRKACEFVYILSVLSSISPRDTQFLVPGTEDLVRLSSLFSVGVHDIPYLEHLRNPQHGGHTPGTEPAEGWAACTTDEIISTKAHLYDVVVELPPTYDTPSPERRWPRIRTNDGSTIKASQRDLTRYRLLHKELFKHANMSQRTAEPYTDDGDGESAPLLSQDQRDLQQYDDDDLNEAYDSSIIEPMKWSRLAYLGFMWWASAGERHAYTTAEREDRELLGELAEYSASIETAVIAYFHRQSSLLIRMLAQLIDARGEEGEASSAIVGEGAAGGRQRNDADDDDEDDEDAITIDRDDLSRMGLDTWSEADRAFVQEFGLLFFGKSIVVKGSEVDCCGLRFPVL